MRKEEKYCSEFLKLDNPIPGHTLISKELNIYNSTYMNMKGVKNIIKDYSHIIFTFQYKQY